MLVEEATTTKAISSSKRCFIDFLSSCSSLRLSSISLRSTRQHKAWGEAKRNPGEWPEEISASEAGGRTLAENHLSLRRLRPCRLLYLGFRFAPRALCCRLLAGCGN